MSENFTLKDIFCEAAARLAQSGNLPEAVKIITRGIQYNQTEDKAKAYRNLPKDLQHFKHYFLTPGKGYW